jgi:hypothetical protein
MKGEWRMEGKAQGKSVIPIVVLSMGLSFLLSLHAGCDSNSDNGDDETDAGVEPCEGHENEARCAGDVKELCRMGHWQSWENCAAVGEICVEDGTDASCQPVLDAGSSEDDSGIPDSNAKL